MLMSADPAYASKYLRRPRPSSPASTSSSSASERWQPCSSLSIKPWQRTRPAASILHLTSTVRPSACAKSTQLGMHTNIREYRCSAELRVHFEPNTWKDYADPAKEHPMAQPIRTIVKLYKEIGSSTLVMPARSVDSQHHSAVDSYSLLSQHCHHERGKACTARCSGQSPGPTYFVIQVLALVSLNPNHITLSGGILDQLAAAPSPESADVPLDGSAASIDTSSSVQGKPDTTTAPISLRDQIEHADDCHGVAQQART